LTRTICSHRQDDREKVLADGFRGSSAGTTLRISAPHFAAKADILALLASP